MPRKRLKFSRDENNKSPSTRNKSLRDKSVNISNRKNSTPTKKNSQRTSPGKARNVSEASIANLETNNEHLESDDSGSQMPRKRLKSSREENNKSPPTRNKSLRDKSVNISNRKSLRGRSSRSLRTTESVQIADIAAESRYDASVYDFVEDGNASPVKSSKRKRGSSKTAEVISESVATSDNPRRSSRYRTAPLARWRNERLKFVTLASGEIKCLGVEEGRKEDDYALRRLQKRFEHQSEPRKSDNKKSKKIHIKKCKFTDVTGNTVKLNLYRPFDTLEWNCPVIDGVQAGFEITKAFCSDLMSFGYLKIFPHKSKEEQYSPNNSIHFMVMKGSVDVSVNKVSSTRNVGESFVVPNDVMYCIKNNESSLALLSFCTSKPSF
ncbi:hypothetical protein CEXT_718311 [Caerostris extrusa]|uniref:Mif2/CENP-C cupin domain-containing protein n=1 Tax=Caerostris extrusa TaxID=172846 RepID=A0AAV4XGZ9_CAEEX|nr:hypothetical protein CEXT_718311 [Caerostris extrusa]